MAVFSKWVAFVGLVTGIRHQSNGLTFDPNSAQASPGNDLKSAPNAIPESSKPSQVSPNSVKPESSKKLVTPGQPQQRNIENRKVDSEVILLVVRKEGSVLKLSEQQITLHRLNENAHADIKLGTLTLAGSFENGGIKISSLKKDVNQQVDKTVLSVDCIPVGPTAHVPVYEQLRISGGALSNPQSNPSCHFDAKIQGSPLAGVAVARTHSLSPKVEGATSETIIEEESIVIFVFNRSADWKDLCFSKGKERVGCKSEKGNHQQGTFEFGRLDESVNDLIARGILSVDDKRELISIEDTSEHVLRKSSIVLKPHINEWFNFYFSNHSLGPEFLVSVKKEEDSSDYKLAEMPIRFLDKFYVTDDRGFLVEMEENATCAFFIDRSNPKYEKCTLVESSANTRHSSSLQSASFKSDWFLSKHPFYNSRQKEKLLYFDATDSLTEPDHAREEILLGETVTHLAKGVSNIGEGSSLESSHLSTVDAATTAVLSDGEASSIQSLGGHEAAKIRVKFPDFITRTEMTFGAFLDALDLQKRAQVSIKNKSYLWKLNSQSSIDYLSLSIGSWYGIRVHGFFAIKVNLASADPVVSIRTPTLEGDLEDDSYATVNKGNIRSIQKAQLNFRVAGIKYAVRMTVKSKIDYSIEETSYCRFLCSTAKLTVKNYQVKAVSDPATELETGKSLVSAVAARPHAAGDAKEFQKQAALKKEAETIMAFRIRFPTYKNIFEMVLGSQSDKTDVGFVIRLGDDSIRTEDWLHVLDYVQACSQLVDEIFHLPTDEHVKNSQSSKLLRFVSFVLGQQFTEEQWRNSNEKGTTEADVAENAVGGDE